MARGRRRLEWQVASAILSMLEGCRMNDVDFEADKFLPEDLGTGIVTRDVSAFRSHVRQGQ